MESISTESLSLQAQQIWAMLDDMSENNPAAYRKFIQRQMDEAREHMSLPDPHMCVQVTLLSKPPRPLFVNFCSWKKVPEPKSPQDPVPVFGTAVTQEDDGAGTFSLTNVAFNPKVLEEYGRNAKNLTDGDTLIQLALDYIEHQQKISVTRTYTILPVDRPHKGDINSLRQSFSKHFKKENQDFEKHVNECENIYGPLTSHEKDSLMFQLSKIAGDGSPESKTEKTDGDITEIKLPGDSKSAVKKGLIEEIKDSKMLTAKYTLETSNTQDGRQLVLTVDLPGIKSVSECQLDISEDDVILVVPGFYDLKVKLPECISDDQANAKFSKKLSLLTLTMPVRT